MSNFFLGPNFRDKITMGSVNPGFIPSEEPASSETQSEAQQDTETTPTTEIKKIKGDRNGKE